MPAPLHRLLSLARSLLRRGRVEHELDEEVRAYVDLLTAEKFRAGLSSPEARRAAMMEVGGVEQIKDAVRDVRAGVRLETVIRDLRYAVRSLRRSPGFAIVTVVSLALGLGLVTTMFALLDAATHPWVPYRDADRLYAVQYYLPGAEARFDAAQVLPTLRDRSDAFEAVLPYGVGEVRLAAPEGGEDEAGPDVVVAAVPPRLFSLLGIKPSRGRALERTDVGGATVVVSDGLWRRLFAGHRGLDGATLALGARRYAVVGVMPSGMEFPAGASVWLPIPDSGGTGEVRAAGVMVKLKPGVSRQDADAELVAEAAYLTRMYHAERAPFAFSLHALRREPMRIDDIHAAMLGAALAVLLIACANLANLMLARGFAKRREVALRLAIGASRGAVVRQMFAECALLTLAGAALGVALSVWGSGILRGSMPELLWWRGILKPQLSWRVFAIAAAAAGVAALLFGLLPAVRVARAVSLDEPLKDGAGTTGRTRQRYSALVISEVALSLMLLMGAGLLLKTVHRLASTQYNFDARHLLFAGIYLPVGRNPGLLDAERSVIAGVKTVPGVADAAAWSHGRLPGLAVTAEMSGDSTRLLNLREYGDVTPGYLRTMGLPVLEGRDFEDGDLGGDGVAILNSVAAARLYPRGGAVGHMVKLGAPAATAPWVRIVGVCRTPLDIGPGTQEYPPDVYVVRPPEPRQRQAFLYIRTQREDPHIASAVAAKLKALGRPSHVTPYLSWWEAEVRSQAFLARLFVMMGAFALLLAAVGIYGVLAYAVSRRLREFAVRVAIGARRADLLKLVLHDGMVMTLAGTAVGAFAALWAARFLSMILEEQRVHPTDALTLIGAEAVLVAVAMAATLAPALRAMRADPIEILRAT
jgi:predicted permease